MLKLGMDTSNSSTRDSLSLLSSQHSKEVSFQPSEKPCFSFWLPLMIDNKLKSEINSSPKWFLVSVFYHNNRKHARTWTNLHCKGLFYRFSSTVYDKSLSNYCLACHQKTVTQSQIDKYSFSHSFRVLWHALLKCLRGNCWQQQRTQAGEAGSYLDPVLRSYDPLSLSFIIISFNFPLDWSRTRVNAKSLWRAAEWTTNP